MNVFESHDCKERWAFLTNVLDVHEANIIKSLLDLHGIPLLVKHKGAGEYLNIYMGMSSFGVNLYVPESMLEQAREIIKDILEDIPEEYIPEERDLVKEEKYLKSRRRKAWGILWLFYLPVLLGAAIYSLQPKKISIIIFLIVTALLVVINEHF